MENTHSKSKGLILLLFIFLMPVALQARGAFGGRIPVLKMMVVSELLESDKEKESKNLIKETADFYVTEGDLLAACCFSFGMLVFLIVIFFGEPLLHLVRRFVERAK